MKTTILLLLFCATISAQTFSYDAEHNLNTTVVRDVPGQSAADMYQKSVNWIKEKYKNPDQVLKADIPNDMIRFTGVKANGFSTKIPGSTFYNDARYTIAVFFKDGKYKLEVVDMIRVDRAHAYDISMLQIKGLHDKKGRLRSTSVTWPDESLRILNELAGSLHEYLTVAQTARSDW